MTKLEQLQADYMEKLEALLAECKEQNVSDEEFNKRMDAWAGAYTDAYQRLAFNMMKSAILKL